VRVLALVVFVTLLSMTAQSGQPEKPRADSSAQRLSSRFAIAAGMGVEYLGATDVTDYINGLVASVGGAQRVSSFKAGVGFFGAVLVPITNDFVVKGEYVYFVGSYNSSVSFGQAEFTLTSHWPSVILQYVLWDQSLYNLKAGAGIGYHFTTLTQKFINDNADLKGKGLGTVLEIEANTAFGDHLFAYLGADLRFEFVGTLDRSYGSSTTGAGGPPTGNAVSAGGRLGLSFIF
jgi:hypothetical protein